MYTLGPCLVIVVDRQMPQGRRQQFPCPGAVLRGFLLGCPGDAGGEDGPGMRGPIKGRQEG